MKNTAGVLKKVTDGVYDIHINILPMRFIILPELAPEEYLWLRCLPSYPRYPSWSPRGCLQDPSG